MSKLNSFFQTNKGQNLIFILSFMIMTIIFYDSVLDKGPLNKHVWRQTDCLSMTHHYMIGNDLFYPEMHTLRSDDYTKGLSAGEFPILYYIVGNVWKLTGESYLVYRITYLIIMFFGLFALFKSLQLLFKDVFWSLTLSLFLFTSPVFAFYGVSFLTDVPALCFTLIGLYFILLHNLERSIRYLYIGFFFIALAGLLKISSLIAFMFLIFILVLESFSIKTIKNQLFFFSIKKTWVGVIGTFLVIFSWYLYAHYFNQKHGFKYTFNDIHPIWLMNGLEVKELLKMVKVETSYLFFSRPTLIFMAITFLINIVLVRRATLFASLSNIVIMIGSVLYFLLWMPLMGVHDYYYSSLLILFLGLVLPLFVYLNSHHNLLFRKKIFKGVFLVFFLYNFMYCGQMMRLRTVDRSDEYSLIGNIELIKKLRWSNWQGEIAYLPFEEMRGYIRTIGIEADDKIISLPDHSFNISLYLLNQRGWTNFSKYSSSGEVQALIDKGAKYLFIANEKTLAQPFLMPFTQHQIGTFKGIKIFSL